MSLIAEGHGKNPGKMMTKEVEGIVGQTKHAGFQIGARRTLDIPLGEAWDFLISPDGLQMWLGLTAMDWTPGARYHTAKGEEGEVRVFVPESHLRLTWQPGGWPRPSTIQVRVIPKGSQTVVAFHQEHLPGPNEREDRKIFFKAVLGKILQKVNDQGQLSGNRDESQFE